MPNDAIIFTCVSGDVLFTEKLLHLYNSLRQLTGGPLAVNTSSVLYSKFIRYALFFVMGWFSKIL